MTATSSPLLLLCKQTHEETRNHTTRIALQFPVYIGAEAVRHVLYAQNVKFEKVYAREFARPATATLSRRLMLYKRTSWDHAEDNGLYAVQRIAFHLPDNIDAGPLQDLRRWRTSFENKQLEVVVRTPSQDSQWSELPQEK